jgi:hypothetical protein
MEYGYFEIHKKSAYTEVSFTWIGPSGLAVLVIGQVIR